MRTIAESRHAWLHCKSMNVSGYILRLHNETLNTLVPSVAAVKCILCVQNGSACPSNARHLDGVGSAHPPEPVGVTQLLRRRFRQTRVRVYDGFLAKERKSPTYITKIGNRVFIETGKASIEKADTKFAVQLAKRPTFNLLEHDTTEQPNPEQSHRGQLC